MLFRLMKQKAIGKKNNTHTYFTLKNKFIYIVCKLIKEKENMSTYLI